MQNGWTNVNSQNGGRLVLHCGAESATRDQIGAAPLPVQTGTFKPLAHMEFLTQIEQELAKRNVNIVSQHLALKGDGMQLFGMFDVDTVAPSGDFRSVLGFRNSNDHSWAAGVVGGSRVFVCDNLAFSGEFICLNRRHTPGLNIEVEIGPALDRWEDNFQLLCGLSDHMKTVELGNSDAKSLMHDIVLDGGFPLRLLPLVAHNYFTPPHAEFEPRNAWSLFNAFTEAAKVIKSTRTNQNSLLAVTREMRQATGFRYTKPVVVATE